MRYSITWSARRSSVCGIVSPSAFARVILERRQPQRPADEPQRKSGVSDNAQFPRWATPLVRFKRKPPPEQIDA
jgi:hypothetical protein